MKNQIKKAYAIIPSAGSGTRFDAALPKQYFKINEEKSINASVEMYLKRKESFSDRTEEELLYLWETTKLSKEYNFYGLLSTLNRAEFDENLIIYEKKMKSALKPLKKLNIYHFY